MGIYIIQSVSESPAGMSLHIMLPTDGTDETSAGAVEFLISRELWIWGKKLAADMTISEEDYLEMEHRATLSRALARVRGILSYSGQSRSGLIQRLRHYGFSDEICEESADYAVAQGLVCEESQVEHAVDIYLHRKYWGRRRIRSELAARGYDAEVIDSVVNAISDEEIDRALHMIIRKKYGAPPKDPTENQKMVLSLLRMGYSAPEIKRAIAAFGSMKS